jgi:hypothetical protein
VSIWSVFSPGCEALPPSQALHLTGVALGFRAATSLAAAPAGELWALGAQRCENGASGLGVALAMDDPKRIVADAYDQIAERYLEWRARQPRQEELTRWLDLLRSYVRPCARVLDIGCGAGIPLTRALSEDFDVTGLDISARQIEWPGGTYRPRASSTAT